MTEIYAQDFYTGFGYKPRMINPAAIKSARHDSYHGHVVEFLDGEKIVERDGMFCPCSTASSRSS